MWDTATTDYKVINTEFGRDLVREYVDACHEAGMRVGLYFSLLDWHDEDITIDWEHPFACQLRQRGLSGDALGSEIDKLNATRDMKRFRKRMYAQFLHDGSELRLRPPKRLPAADDTVLLGGIEVPAQKPGICVPVVEVWLK